MDASFNADLQHTLKTSISISGTGLHTGVNVDMSLNPANPGFGIQFKRIDLPGQPLIKADCDLVTDTSRGTTLEDNGAKVSTVEHVLAALVGMGVDNCLIEINGPETPIIDGSSEPFVEIIEEAGVLEQEAAKSWYTIDTNITYYNEEKRVELVAMPAVEYKITTLIDFNSPVLGTQHAGLKSIRDFKSEIAPCRTFCFLHELEMLLDHNLIKGGDINNAIVVVDKPVTEKEMARLATVFKKDNIEVMSEGYLNNLQLRFPNEPARHKLLDIMGDLALVGHPIKGKVVATRPGHSANTRLAKIMRQEMKKALSKRDIPVYDASQPPVLTVEEIKKRLPHRFPFLLVDKIIYLDGTSIVGIKNVTFNESFFQGHFPDEPIMPGVLLVEALAQTGGLLVLCSLEDPEKYSTYFLKIDKLKFKHKVVPGDTVILKMELTDVMRRGIVTMFGQAFVGSNLILEGEMTAQVIKNK